MNRIYKYQFLSTGKQTLTMPLGSKIVSIQMQHHYITVWAIVDRDQPDESRYFWILDTGEQIFEPSGETKLYYLATVQAGQMVWHVFEEAPDSSVPKRITPDILPSDEGGPAQKTQASPREE